MKRILIGIAALLWTVCAYADLSLQVVQGVDKPYPIAIVPFSEDHYGSGIASILQSDLSSSGQFEVLPVASQPENPHNLSSVNWGRWQAADSSLEFLVIGSLVPGENGTQTLTVQVISVLGHRQLLGRVFNNVPVSQLRSLSHYVSDLIYSTITGLRGNFSTRLAYVEVLNPLSPKPIYRLIVSDADGHHPQMLLQQVNNPIASPAWSADGQKLAYVSYLNNRMTIYAITLSTGQREVMASFKGMNSAPSFSPDGRYLAMALSMGQGSRTDIYIMDLSSRQLTRLTNTGSNTSPSWSPDSQKIVFTSDRSGNPQVYELSLKDHSAKRLTYQGLRDFSGILTPDGHSLIFMYQASRDSSIQLAKLDLSTQQLTVLTHGQIDKSPSLAPNGQMIVYANYDGVNGSLAETSLNGKIHIQLPATQGSVQSPAWSPFLN